MSVPALDTRSSSARFFSTYVEGLHTVLAVVTATVLVIAGAAKVQASIFELVMFGANGHHLAAVALGAGELFLAAVLIHASGRLLPWLLVTVTFGGFALYASSLGADAECGCAGNLDVNHNALLMLDWVVSLGAGLVCFSIIRSSAIFRSRGQNWLFRDLPVRSPAWFVFLVLGFIAGGVGIRVDLLLSTRSLYCSDKEVVASHFDSASGVFRCSVQLRNLSRSAISIVGWKPKCGTQFSGGLDQVILPGESVEVSILSKMMPNTRKGELTIGLYGDRNGILIEDSIPIRVALGDTTSRFKELDG